MALRRIVMVSLRDDDRPLDVERWGLRLRLHPCRNGCEKGVLFTPQMYEALELAELSKQIEDTKRTNRAFVFVDVGANVGLFSLFVASRVGRDATILAFEPEPENGRRFQFNLNANPGLPIQFFQLALGDEAGEVALEVDNRDRGGTRIVGPRNVSNGYVLRVRCEPLLAVLARSEIDTIDALKIDVEGYEAEVLVPFFRDAPQSLWPRMMIIEDTRAIWSHDLLSELEQRRYQLRARTKLNMIMERA